MMSFLKKVQNILKKLGFKEVKKTYDLQNNPIFENNIETEHEKMFLSQGIKIKAGIFKI